MGGSGSKEKKVKEKKEKNAKKSSEALKTEPTTTKTTEPTTTTSSTTTTSTTTAATATTTTAATATSATTKPTAQKTEEKKKAVAAAATAEVQPNPKTSNESKSAQPAAQPAAAATSDPEVGEGKLFAAPKGPQHSKIFQALNPEKLWYESRREKEEAKDDVVKLSIRGGGAGMAMSAVDFAVERDDDGNIVEDQELEGVHDVEENFDPKNLPDFGELQGELDALRKERAEKQRKHQEDLRRAWNEKKAAEEQQRKTELERIQAAEDELARKQPTVGKEFITNAQQRMEAESLDHYRTFSFKASP